MDYPLLRIMLVAEDASVVAQVTAILEEHATFSYCLESEASVEGAIQRLTRQPTDLALLDLDHEDETVLERLSHFHQQVPHVPVIVLAGQAGGHWAVNAIQRGASDCCFYETLSGPGLLESVRRVMNRKRREDAELADRNLVQSLLEQTTDHIYFKDRDSRFTRINQALSRNLGLRNAAEAVGMSDDDLYPRGAAEEARADEVRIMETGEPLINKEEYGLWPDGRETWTSTTKMPLRDADGHIVGTFGISRDITRRKLAEREVRDIHRFLDSIVENIPNMIFVKDAVDLRFVRINKAGEELLGHDRTELVGKSDYDFFPAPEADFFTKKDREVVRGKQVVDIPEESIQSRTKGPRILHTRKIPLFDVHGQPQYLLGISEDITDWKMAQAERAEAEAKEREVLERTDRLNTIGLLAAGMAHEINNPLQGMSSHLSHLKRLAAADRKAGTSLLMLERGVETISALVKKLLALGHTSRETAAERADCGSAIRFVLQLTESQLARAGIETVVRGHHPAVVLAISDKELIQVLLNIIINARDAMPEGGTLTIATDQEENEVAIALTDTGVGMSEEVQKRIFTPFYTTKGARGTGLGLVVAASLIHAAGGAINVDSALGAGTTFTLRIPLEETNHDS